MSFGGDVAISIVVAFRLRHRFAFHFEMFKVDPVTNELLPCCAFTLGNLILMMREYEIYSAGMNIESFAQILHRHRRAFDVPAGTAASDWHIECSAMSMKYL